VCICFFQRAVELNPKDATSIHLLGYWYCLITVIIYYYNHKDVKSKKLNPKVYLNPGSKFTYIINYILNDYDQ